MKKIFFTLLLWTLALVLHAQQMYENKNIKHSFDVFQAEAAKGNIVGIHELGNVYNYGSIYTKTFNGEVDYNKAVECYKKAFAYGYPWSAWELARMYGAGKLKDTEDKANEEMWSDKAFNGFKIYADRGDVHAMEKLTEYYAGYNLDKYSDNLKGIYWSLRTLNEGELEGAWQMAMCYTYGKGVEKDSLFALAWCARHCIEVKKKGWPVEGFPSYEDLVKAGYSEEDWKRLAEHTYNIDVPCLQTENEDSINDAAILAIDMLNMRAEDFRIALRAQQSVKTDPVSSGSFTGSTIPAATSAETNAVNRGGKRKWLSAIGRALGAVATGQSAQALSAEGAAGDVHAQAFRYDGEQRKGQKDFNGRIISHEYTLPCAYGKAHYTWYQDGYCFVHSASTCVVCYGRKRCGICGGKGKTYHAYFKTYQPCISCMGNGLCKTCKGVGYTTMSKLWAPGEADAYLAAKREVESESSSSGSSSSSSSSSSKSGTCPKCGGKGYLPESHTYAAGSMYAPFHNSGGTSCPICSKATDHYHYRCYECKRH